LAWLYMTAKEKVIRAGYADEIDWQDEVKFKDLNEPTFLREAAWVVLSAGFREAVVRKRFGQISSAFLNWSDSRSILSKREECRYDALLAFGNRRKIEGILKIVERVATDGIDDIIDQVAARGIEFIKELPFMGPITARHLAKNLGIMLVKPDRHLSRIANRTGYESADAMCQTIADVVGDSVAVIDIVLWRYATLYDLGTDMHLLPA
ncbi:MAG: hypothetical protein PHY31_09735, partial [Smithellaceae bacterium]|nr:hypothetical protein [Smithellaceae bacterium]